MSNPETEMSDARPLSEGDLSAVWLTYSGADKELHSWPWNHEQLVLRLIATIRARDAEIERWKLELSRVANESFKMALEKEKARKG